MKLLNSSLVACLVLGVLASCEQKPVTQQVQGTVTYTGKPLEHGMINFLATGARPIGAPIASDGTYSVELPPGQYAVIVIAPPKLPGGFQEGEPLPPPDPNAVPAKYSRPETSGLSATIELLETPQTVDFELK